MIRCPDTGRHTVVCALDLRASVAHSIVPPWLNPSAAVLCGSVPNLSGALLKNAESSAQPCMIVPPCASASGVGAVLTPSNHAHPCPQGNGWPPFTKALASMGARIATVLHRSISASRLPKAGMWLGTPSPMIDSFIDMPCKIMTSAPPAGPYSLNSIDSLHPSKADGLLHGCSHVRVRHEWWVAAYKW